MVFCVPEHELSTLLWSCPSVRSLRHSGQLWADTFEQAEKEARAEKVE